MGESKESAQTRKLKCICSSVAGSRHVWSQCYSVTWPVATPGCARRVVGSRKNKKQNLEFKLQLNADEWAIGHWWKFETHCSYWVQTVSELNFRGLLLLNNLKVELRGVVKRQKRQNAAVFRLDTTQTKTSFVLVCLRLSNSLQCPLFDTIKSLEFCFLVRICLLVLYTHSADTLHSNTWQERKRLQLNTEKL